MLNRQQLGFRIYTRKLNRRPFGFRRLNRRQLELKAHEHLVTCSQRDMHQWEKLERHPSELSSHVKFSKLNRSLRLGFRTSELLTVIESGNMKECQTATQYHRSLAGTSGCSRPLQLLKQSKESSKNNTLRIEQLSSTTSSTGAHQHQSQQVQLLSNSYTSLSDKQEDTPGSIVAADSDNYDRDQERRGPVIKLDDQCELTSEARATLIIDKNADESGFSRTIALLVQSETDKKEYRYDDSHHLSARQSYVIVPSTLFDDAVQRECH